MYVKQPTPFDASAFNFFFDVSSLQIVMGSCSTSKYKFKSVCILKSHSMLSRRYHMWGVDRPECVFIEIVFALALYAKDVGDFL